MKISKTRLQRAAEQNRRLREEARKAQDTEAVTGQILNDAGITDGESAKPAAARIM